MHDDTDAERLLRATLPALGGWAATAIYPMRAADAAVHAITGSFTGALTLGRRLREAQPTPLSRVPCSPTTAPTLLFTGGVLEVLRHARPCTGGTLTIEHHSDPQHTLRLEMANEIC
ncbi:hypothetical protein AB0G12_39210 [Nonomuraea dietziae]